MSELLQGNSRFDTVIRMVTVGLLVVMSAAIVWTTLHLRNESTPAGVVGAMNHSADLLEGDTDR